MLTSLNMTMDEKSKRMGSTTSGVNPKLSVDTSISTEVNIKPMHAIETQHKPPQPIDLLRKPVETKRTGNVKIGGQTPAMPPLQPASQEVPLTGKIVSPINVQPQPTSTEQPLELGRAKKALFEDDKDEGLERIKEKVNNSRNASRNQSNATGSFERRGAGNVKINMGRNLANPEELIKRREEEELREQAKLKEQEIMLDKKAIEPVPTIKKYEAPVLEVKLPGRRADEVEKNVESTKTCSNKQPVVDNTGKASKPFVNEELHSAIQRNPFQIKSTDLEIPQGRKEPDDFDLFAKELEKEDRFFTNPKLHAEQNSAMERELANVLEELGRLRKDEETWKRQKEDLGQQLLKARRESDNYRNESNALANDVKRYTTEAGGLKEELEQARRALKEQRDNLGRSSAIESQLTKEIETLRLEASSKRSLELQLKELALNSDALKRENSALKEKALKINESAFTAESELSRLKKDNLTLRAQIDEINEKYRVLDMKTQNTLNDSNIYLGEINKLSEENSSLREQVHNRGIEAEEARLLAEKQSKRDSALMQSKEHEIQQLTLKVKEVQSLRLELARRDDALEELRNRQADMGQQTDSANRLEREKNDLSLALNRASGQIELLQTLNKEMEAKITIKEEENTQLNIQLKEQRDKYQSLARNNLSGQSEAQAKHEEALRQWEARLQSATEAKEISEKRVNNMQLELRDLELQLSQERMEAEAEREKLGIVQGSLREENKELNRKVLALEDELAEFGEKVAQLVS